MSQRSGPATERHGGSPWQPHSRADVARILLLVAAVVAVVILVFFAIGYGLAQLLL